MNLSRRGFRALVVATLAMYLRNPLGPSAVFLFLLFFLAAMRLVNVQQPQPIKLALANHATSPEAARLAAAIRDVNAFAVTDLAEDEAAQQLAEAQVDLTVSIPADVGSAEASGQPRPARLQVAHQAVGAGATGLLLLRGVVDRFNLDLLHQPPLVMLDVAEVQPIGLGFIDAMLPGLLAFNVVQAGLLLAAGVFAGYRSSGVLRRLQATGTAPATFVLAHATSTFLLGVVQTAVLLLAASLLFTVQLNLPLLLAITALGYLVFLALGFAISGWVRDPQRAPAVAMSIGMPMIMAGLFPAAAVPPVIAAVVGALPIGALTDAMRQVALGGSVASIGPDLLRLVVWAGVLLLAASRVFRWDDA